MNEKNNEDRIEWIEKLIKYSSDGDEVINSLVGNLVNYLVKKEVIEIEDYLDFTKNTRDVYISNLKKEGHDEESNIVNHVKKQFNMHINDFEK
ncbi:MAG: hypothetical protein LBV35_02200 [Acinetobacter sp.]|uniref:hypothetical protein n=1 Tax=Acinetobacter sp. TaxID=472 RepID=UPI00284A9CF9|nr:hypothetical protein [Acinetobacter sp.]MDR3027251.1 hypothetical protein [Acinetobacter sp.]